MLEKTLNSASLVLNQQPAYLLLHVTGKCNAECSHCFYWQEIKEGKTQSDLEFDHYKKISDSLGELLVVNLCGAEAYLRKDLCDLVHLFSSRNRCRLMTIPSNGFLTEQIVASVERMCKENPNTFFRFAFSLDGPKQEHDRIRGVEGLFEKACETIRQVARLKEKYSNFVLITSTVFSQETQGYILDFLDWIKANLPVEQTNVTFVRGNPMKPETLNVDPSVYRKVLEKVRSDAALQKQDKKLESILPYSLFLETMKTVEEAQRHPEKRVFDCFAGRKFLVVGRKGDVYPCEILDAEHKLGYLGDFDWDLQKLLRSSRAQEVNEWIDQKHCACTWECAIQASKVFDAKQWPQVAIRAAKVMVAGQ